MPRLHRRAARPSRSFAALLAVAALATAFTLPGRPADAVATDTPVDTWVTNGDVHAVLNAGGRTYLGGTFDQVGPNTGFGVPLDQATGAAAATIAKVNGQVYTAVPDGADGWYIGGKFTRVGSKSVHYAARIKSDGSVAGWNPNPDLPVHSIVVDNPNKRIYIGGEFTTIRTDTKLPDGTYDTVAAGGLAATKKSDGSFDAASPLPAINTNPLPDGPRFSVNALALSGSELYVGGTFTAFGGVARAGLAMVDLAATPALNAAWNPQPDGAVTALMDTGGRLLVGGVINHMGGAVRTG
ncbi:MAG TPA: hypothetical protein VGR20_10340, partial [Acidimicrobiia bacterium]|nr:hypothetical protein [Acidimicrobiia bacterium]